MVCGGTMPWSGVLPVLLCLDTHCHQCHFSALTPGDKECAGDTQMSPATRLGVLVAGGLGGYPHDGESQDPNRQGSWGCWRGGQGMWGFPSTHRTTQAQFHSKRGCGRAWGQGIASHREGRRQQSCNPNRAPHHLLLGCWELGTEPGGWEGRRGGSTGVSQGHKAKESEWRKEASREKTKLPKTKTQTHQSARRQLRARRATSHQHSPGHCREAGGQEGCSHPARAGMLPGQRSRAGAGK